MSPKLRLVLVFHNHQPIGNFDGVFEQAYQDSYRPFLDVFEQYDDLPIALHTSGSLMEWLVARHPEYLDRLAALVAAGRMEIVGGAFYEADPDDDSAPRSRRADHALCASGSPTASARRSTACGCPSACGSNRSPATWPTPASATRCSTTSTSRTPASTKTSSTATTSPKTTASCSPSSPAASGCATRFRSSEPEETIDYLRPIAEQQPGAVVVFGDDGEKFGVWPGTKEHVYENGWLRRFFDALVANRELAAASSRRPKRSTRCRRWARFTFPRAATAK